MFDFAFLCSYVTKYEDGFILVDLNRLGHRNYSFILASQAKQMFYMKDPKCLEKWYVVLTTRSKYYHKNSSEDDKMIVEHETFTHKLPSLDIDNNIEECDNIYTREMLKVHGSIVEEF